VNIKLVPESVLTMQVNSGKAGHGDSIL